MRFIDVTRYGGVKTLRLSVAAIAYVDVCEGGSVIRLIGGESLRVNEDRETVEARAIDEGFLAVEEIIGEPLPLFEQGEAPEPRLATAGADVTAEGITMMVLEPPAMPKPRKARRKGPARKGKRK